MPRLTVQPAGVPHRTRNRRVRGAWSIRKKVGGKKGKRFVRGRMNLYMATASPIKLIKYHTFGYETNFPLVTSTSPGIYGNAYSFRNSIYDPDYTNGGGRNAAVDYINTLCATATAGMYLNYVCYRIDYDINVVNQSDGTDVICGVQAKATTYASTPDQTYLNASEQENLPSIIMKRIVNETGAKNQVNFKGFINVHDVLGISKSELIKSTAYRIQWNATPSAAQLVYLHCIACNSRDNYNSAALTVNFNVKLKYHCVLFDPTVV